MLHFNVYAVLGPDAAFMQESLGLLYKKNNYVYLFVPSFLSKI